MKLSELTPDPKNTNRGTKRGGEAVAQSLRQYGAGRSILIDSKGRVIAGNKTVENAMAAGIEDVLIIPSDGTKIIAVQRTDLDLDDPKAKALAIADNRTSEIGLEWDAANLAELSTDLDLRAFFTDVELAEIIAPEADALCGSGATGAPGPETLEGRYRQQYGVIVICENEAEQRKVYEQLTGQGLECRVVVT